ncbi:unnamed protein product [Tilletia controversa]|nr:unnamed protein product [Tilletia controversa]
MDILAAHVPSVEELKPDLVATRHRSGSSQPTPRARLGVPAMPCFQTVNLALLVQSGQLGLRLAVQVIPRT